MLTIKRTCTNKIITRALQQEGRPLIAVLPVDAEDCKPCENENQLNELLGLFPASMVVYNQHPDAIKLVQQLQLPDAQVFVEISQDTRGVLGLHAIRKHGNLQETLELIYQ
jgi:hypothetical protein